MPASSVTWTTTGDQGGSGTSGTVSAVSYGTVFESQTNPSSGGTDIVWTLAPPPSGVHGGTHTLVLRWKVEAVIP